MTRASCQPIDRAVLDCRNADGRVVARLRLYATERFDESHPSLASLVQLDPQAAKQAGEAVIQLRENGRYEYALEPRSGNLRVQCSLARRSARCAPDEDFGVIETGAHCGALRIDMVRGDGSVAGTGYVEVRSVKLGYRDQYRAMLNDIAAHATALLFDARLSSQIPLSPAWRDEPRFLQQQIEFLRETLESPAFRAATQRILDFPHRRLTPETELRSIEHPFKHNRDLMRQISRGAPRVAVPRAHPLSASLRARGVAQPSLPQRVLITQRTDGLDTPENQFVKFALESFRDFLGRAATSLRNCGVEWSLVADRAMRAQHTLDRLLAHSFFAGISPLRAAPPISSPVLQRKAGYREVLQAWLRFQANARLNWDAADDLFHAGVRDVASLYEYWLFFQLLDWFCARFAGAAASARQLLEPTQGGVTLKLKRGVTAGPFEGIYARSQRRIKAQFHYNRRFHVSAERRSPGSWSRAMQPDYTFTFWPAAYSLEEAEAQEIAVHLHFDAKYRVDSLEALFGQPGDENADAETENASSPQGAYSYKRADLLKMHAYRDAIRRSEGAYVLYPGSTSEIRYLEETGFLPGVMRDFDEILPSIGAFAVAPGTNGSPQGMARLSAFLDAMLEHVSNRATQREQRTYHTLEAMRSAEGGPLVVPLELGERDAAGWRAVPPHEQWIVVASDETEAIEWMLANRRVVLNLGDRHQALKAMKRVAAASHVLLRSRDEVQPGLLRLLDESAVVLAREDLSSQGYPYSSGERDDLFAVLKVEADLVYRAWRWDGERLRAAIKACERRREPLFAIADSTSPALRILSLGDLIGAAVRG